MKAIVLTRYGPAEMLQLREIEKPTPGEGELLVKIHAATVHTGDCEIRRFDIMPLVWLPLRLFIGVRRPRGNRVLGQEFAGAVEAVGPGVTRFAVGDEIFGTTGLSMGGYAEYICLPEKRAMTRKPPNVTYEAATVLPVAGQNALHFLREAGIQPGQDVLIFGSTGSIGTVAVQLAKHFGANVTAVCSTGKIELVESLGADHIIDYTKEDFTQNGLRYDIIFDTIGKSSFSRSMTSLKDDGVYIQANPSMSDMVRGPIASRRSDKRVILKFAGDSSEDLAYLAKLAAEGKIRSIIDRAYPLEEAVDAHRYTEEGHKAGNVILTMTRPG